MSNISTIYDTLLTSLAALFPSKTRIPNPYSLEDNPHGLLEDGYGLRVDELTSITDFELRSYDRTRAFSVIFTKDIITTDERNITSIDTAIKGMLDDITTVSQDFVELDQMGISSNVQIIEMTAGSAVSFLKGDKFDFITMEVSFSVQIQEPLIC